MSTLFAYVYLYQRVWSHYYLIGFLGFINLNIVFIYRIKIWTVEAARVVLDASYPGAIGSSHLKS